MNASTLPRHPLRSGGTTRRARLQAALLPSSFRLDDRAIQDLIVTAHDFASTLRYIGPTDSQPEGVYWDRFWEVESLTYLAIVAAKDTERIRQRFYRGDAALKRKLDQSPAPGRRPLHSAVPEAYLLLLRQLHRLAWSLEQVYRKLVAIDHPLRSVLLQRIRRDNACDPEEMNSALKRLIALHRGADPALDMEKYRGFFTDDNRWGLRSRVEYDAIAADPAISRKALREIFTSFYDTWVVLKNAAQSSFNGELARMNLPEEQLERAVQPHIALFLAFLQLFRHAQDSLNEFGQRHLDYYYEQVLRLRRRAEIPDEVFLVIELAKGLSGHLLEAGTALLAGKDKNGRPLVFETIEDWVVRPAQVADVKTVYFDHEAGRIRANPDIAGVYDNGAVVPNEKARYWRALGDDAGLPDGEVGFAIASPQLILREGRRIVDVRIDLSTQSPPGLAQLEAGYFTVLLSSEEKWITLGHDPLIDVHSTEVNYLQRGAFNAELTDESLHLRLVLERDDLPVVAPGAALSAGSNFSTQWPILKVIVNPVTPPPVVVGHPAATTVSIVELLLQLTIEEVTIRVDVRGIRENLIFQSDQGIFDGTQKILPFGPIPELGSQFYIGSAEAFQKALDSLSVRINWLDAPTNIASYYSAYAGAGYAVPKPVVQIDFIDRAQESTAKKVIRQGALGLNGAVQGTVTDLLGNPQNGIVVEALLNPGAANETTIATANSDASGAYTINTTSGGATGPASATHLRFSLPGSDFEPATEAIANAATVNIVLYPLKTKVQGAFTGTVGGRVMDPFGVLLDQVIIKPVNAANTATSGGTGTGSRANNFSINNLAANARLNFTRSGYQPASSIPTEGFTLVDVYLRPTQSVIAQAGSLPTHRLMQGKVTAPDGGSIPGALVQASGSGVQVTARTNAQGDYALAVPAGTTAVSFQRHPAFGPLQATARQTVDVELFPTAPVRKTALFDGTITGSIRDVHGNLIDGISIQTANPASSGIFDQTFSISGLNEDTSVTFSKAGDFEPLVIDSLGKFSSLDVVLFPAMPQRILPSGAALTTTPAAVSGKVTDLRGSTGIGGVEVFLNGASSPATTTAADGTYSVSGVELNDELLFQLPGAPHSMPINAVTQANLDILLELTPHKKSTAAPAGQIEITVTDRVNQPEPNPSNDLVIILEHDSKFQEVLPGINANAYSLSVPAASSWQIQAKHDAFTAPAFDVQEGDRIVIPLTRQVLRRNPVRTRLGGRVLTVGQSPIRGARLTTQNGVSQKTNAQGRFEFTQLPAGQPVTFTVEHDGYETISGVIVDENCEITFFLVPKTAFQIVTGQITDVYSIPLDEIVAALKDTDLTTESAGGGQYELPVPIGQSNRVLVFRGTGFDTVEYDLATEAETFSMLDVRMYYIVLNSIQLVRSDGGLLDTFPVNLNAFLLKRDIRTQSFSKFSHTLKRGFIRFTLQEASFLHSAYPKVLLWYALAAAQKPVAADKVLPDPLPPIPNQPYTPATNSISLDYTSTQSIVRDNDGIDRYFQLLPFNGHKPVPLFPKPGQPLPPIRLVYPFTPNETLPVIDASGPQPVGHMATGNLYIGVADLEPGTNLSLLVEIAAGTEPEPEQTPARIFWSYLAIGDVWKPFSPKQLLRDTTHELTRSGLLQFAMPATAARNSTMLDSRYYWLRASTDLDPAHRPYRSTPRAMPSIVSIRAQAVTARFRNNDNDLAHLAGPLPAATIGKLALSRTAVKKLTQPLESFGGRLPETAGLEFYQRVSERLRHKDRAVTPWDYEHLLLERFPEVAAAKCIPHTRYKIADDNARIGGQPFEQADHGAGLAPGASELTPGYVTVAVVPDLRRRAGEPWPEPRFPKAELDELRTELGQHTNLFVDFPGDPLINGHLQVVNPLYEAIDVAVNVEFYPEVDAAFHRVRLAEEIRAFISPWLETPEKPPAFNRVLRRSEILQFIEERPYVDYVYVETGLKVTMPVIDIAGNAGVPPVIRLIEEDIPLSTARSILVAGRIVVNPVYEELTLTVTLFADAEAESALPGTPSTDHAAALTAALTRFVTLPWSGSDRPSSFARLLRGQDIVDFIEALPYRSELTVDPPEVALTNRPFEPFRQAHPAQAQFRAIGTPPDAVPPAEIVLTTPDSVLLLGSIALQSGAPVTAKLSAGPGAISRPARAPRKKTAASAKPEPPPDPAKPPRRTRK